MPDDPYELIREDVRESISDCDRFFNSLKAEVEALKPLPKRARSPEPPPEEPELSPDAKAARTMLALGNLRIGRPANAFFAEAFDARERLVAEAARLLGEIKKLGPDAWRELDERLRADRPVRVRESRALLLAIAAIEATPEKSNRSIAKEIGVNEITVRRARKNVASPMSHLVRRIEKDGKLHPGHKETGDHDHLSPQEARDQHRGAFMIRAEHVAELAVYDDAEAPINDDIIASAEYAANAWKALALKLKSQHRRK